METVYFAIKALAAQTQLFETLMEEVRPIVVEIHELESWGKSLATAKNNCLQPAALNPTKVVKLILIQMNSSQIYMLVAWESHGRVQGNSFCETIIFSPNLFFILSICGVLNKHNSGSTNTTYDLPIGKHFAGKLLIGTLMQKKTGHHVDFWVWTSR